MLMLLQSLSSWSTRIHTGKSKPMSDGEQRSEQFKEGKGDSKIESGSATDIGKVRASLSC